MKKIKTEKCSFKIKSLKTIRLTKFWHSNSRHKSVNSLSWFLCPIL